MSSHPKKKPSVKPRPKDGPEQLYRVHASITTDLASIWALNECDALGKWLGGENVRGRLIAGRLRQEPFPYLEARIDAGKPEEQIVHVISDDVLADPDLKALLFQGDPFQGDSPC